MFAYFLILTTTKHNSLLKPIMPVI